MQKRAGHRAGHWEVLEKIIRKAAYGEAKRDVGRAFCNVVICSVSHKQGDPGKLRGGGGVRHVSIHGGSSELRTSCGSRLLLRRF